MSTPPLQNLLLFMITIQVFVSLCDGSEPDSILDSLKLPNALQTVKLSTKSKKGATGEWTDSFAALTNTSTKSSSQIFEVTHKVAVCGERRILYLQGVINGDASESSIEKLTFHPKSGTNVAILSNEITAQKINIEQWDKAVAFTKRPLRDNEIFEIILEKKHNKFTESLGVGVSTKSPENYSEIPNMWTSPTAWMFYHDIIYNNGKELLKPYGQRTDNLQVGDRLGVMRNQHGVIHFFVNGVDQGPAVSNVPKPVYGVLDLHHNAAKATIWEAERV